MTQLLTCTNLRRHVYLIVACLLSGLLIPESGTAQDGTLAEPFPTPAPNAALHYQRALLHAAKLDDDQTQLLSKPIWEVAPTPIEDQLPREVSRLLRRGRFAIQSAALGSRTAECNFGIDFSGSGAASQLPHVEGMVQLGRLLTLRGTQAEAKGEWEEALIIYFDGVRMGRHLTHQATLIEAFAGIEILRNNYFAIARWASRCPVRLLVARAFGLFESMQAGLIDPPQTIAREASILALEFDKLRQAYPDGNWEQVLLDSFGDTVTGDRAADRKAAVSACLKRGVPESVFESTDAFERYLSKLEATSNRFVESVAACMTLPPQACLKRAAALNKKYSAVLPILSSDTLVDATEIGALLAQHDAELTVTRLVLAVTASKESEQYPSSLDEVAPRFGGRVPLDPYSFEPVIYQTDEDRRSFSIEIPALGRLPRSSFESRSPKPAT
jgi:hypothetical protein